jgi:chromosome segregation ATPase
VAKQKLSERRKQLNEMRQELNTINGQINTYTVNLTNLQETMAIIQGFQGCAIHLEKMMCDCHNIVREKDLLVKLRNEMEERIISVSEDCRQLKAEEEAAVKGIDRHADILAFASAHAHVARVFKTLLSAGIEGISKTWDPERIESLAAIFNEVSKEQEASAATCEEQGGT